MLHLQFLEELAQRRRGPIRKRLEPDWRDAGIDLLYSVNRLADMLDAVDGPMPQTRFVTQLSNTSHICVPNTICRNFVNKHLTQLCPQHDLS